MLNFPSQSSRLETLDAVHGTFSILERLLFARSKNPFDVAVAYNNAHYIAYHCWTLGFAEREYVDGKICSFIDLVPVFRQNGNDILEGHIVSFIDGL
jgi:hypothetical protein